MTGPDALQVLICPILWPVMSAASANRRPSRDKRTPPATEDTWKALGAALARFMAKYQLTQAWIAETMGVSQPQVSYILGNTQRERARELTGSEACAIELRVRAEKNRPDLVLGEIWRDAGLVEDVAHPADVVAAYPFIDPDIRSDIVTLIERAEGRYLQAVQLDEDETPPPARLR